MSNLNTEIQAKAATVVNLPSLALKKMGKNGLLPSRTLNRIGPEIYR